MPEQPDEGLSHAEIYAATWGKKCTARGTIRSDDGEPMAGCRVVPHPTGSATGSAARALPEMAARTNSEGRYRWDLPAGTYRLEVYGESDAGVPLRGSISDVIAVESQKIAVDITVTPQTT